MTAEPFKTDLDGQTYRGWFEVTGDLDTGLVLTVRSDYGSRSAVLYSLTIDHLAGRLLREIILDWNRRNPNDLARH
jgi:hypothetical protein